MLHPQLRRRLALLPTGLPPAGAWVDANTVIDTSFAPSLSRQPRRRAARNG